MEAVRQHLMQKAERERLAAANARKEAQELHERADDAEAQSVHFEAVATECDRLAGLYPIPVEGDVGGYAYAST
jgi:hypothetical protein